MSYCNLLLSTHIVLSSKSHGTYWLFSYKFHYIYNINDNNNHSIELVFEFINLS